MTYIYAISKIIRVFGRHFNENIGDRLYDDVINILHEDGFQQDYVTHDGYFANFSHPEIANDNNLTLIYFNTANRVFRKEFGYLHQE
jgi:hypothetical protein